MSTTKFILTITSLFVCISAHAQVIIPGSSPGVIVAGSTSQVAPTESHFVPPVQPIAGDPEKPPTPAQPERSAYPLNAVNWNVNGHWQYSREYIINHLANESIHNGKFSRKWLESLSMKELQSLHDDDHESEVHWEYVSKPVAQVKQKRQAIRYVQPATNCPNGNCPKPVTYPQRRVKGGLLRSIFGGK